MSSSIPISIAHICPKLSPTYDGKLPPYRRIYLDVLGGKIPAENLNGRWYVSEADLPAIAQNYGLTPKV